jgi:O-antigen ligase
METTITISGQPVTLKEDLSAFVEPLRSRGTDRILLGALIVWMLYAVSGFRLPTQPILISDADASAVVRQILFGMTGMLAFARLFLSQTLGPVLVMRRHIMALAALLLLSVLWSTLPIVTLKRSLIFVFGLVSLTVMVHSSVAPARLMLRTVYGFTVAVAGLSILFHFILPENCTVNPARPGLAGIAIHPNTLAPFMSIGFLISLGLKGSGGFKTIAFLGGRGLIVAALLMTLSITTLITTFTGLAIFTFLNAGNYRRGVFQLIAVSIVALVAIIGVDTLKSSFFDAAGRDESLSGRDQLWEVVWHKSLESPLVGNGFGAFWTEGKGRELVQTWNPRQSHNAYLDVMLDLGLLGLAAVLLLFPIWLLFVWKTVQGAPGTAQRRATSAMMAVAWSYMLLYSMGQSFFLRFDVFPFFMLTWITLIMSNTDSNGILCEFEETDA